MLLMLARRTIVTPEERENAKEQARLNAEALYDREKQRVKSGLKFFLKWGTIGTLLLIGGCVLLIKGG